ncbi:MAG: GNAT family N-acetyltransferase [Flavobacteriales bacterium]|nr:GNAT family N-acetyltransferase [Flavobacteriales bacterium]
MDVELTIYELADAEELALKANNPNIARYLTDGFPSPYSLEDALSFIEKFSSQNPIQVFLIKVNGEIAGGIGIHPQNDIMRLNAELGYWVAEDMWGYGIATKAITQMVRYGFENFNITRIYARPFGSNIASQRVLEKCGFELEARIEQNIIKNGIVEDELIYAIRKENLPT